MLLPYCVITLPLSICCFTRLPGTFFQQNLFTLPNRFSIATFPWKCQGGYFLTDTTLHYFVHFNSECQKIFPKSRLLDFNWALRILPVCFLCVIADSLTCPPGQHLTRGRVTLASYKPSLLYVHIRHWFVFVSFF